MALLPVMPARELKAALAPAPPELHPCWSGYSDKNLYCYSAVLLARKGQTATNGDMPCS